MNSTQQQTAARRWGALLLLCCALLLAGCLGGPKPNTLYTLYATEEQPINNEFAGFQDMILVMPVRMAPQLQNRGLLYQHSAAEAQSAASHLWAGALDQQIADNLVGNMKNLLQTENVAVFPGPRYGTTRYQVEIEIHEFSGNSESFSLEAVYTISDAERKIMLERKRFQRKQQNNPPGYSGYAASASLALGELSRQTAQALVQVHRNEKSAGKK